MINASTEYKAAIVGDSRRMYIKAQVHVVDPDIVYGEIGGMAQLSNVSRPAQLYDGETKDGTPYITFELNRWLLDGTFDAIENLDADDEVGWVCGMPQDTSGEGEKYVDFSFSGVDVLNACTVAFPDNDFDGYPVRLQVAIYSGDTQEYLAEINNNTKRSITVTGFSVANPTKIRVVVKQWSLPVRRMRVTEIVAGVHDVWDESIIAEFSVVHQSNPSMTSLPYGTAEIVFDNTDHRFDPYNKAGLFESLEERQGIDLFLGVGIDGKPEFKKLGVFYQYADGWKIRSGLTIKWSLVDIIGLLSQRSYVVPNSAYNTLGAWVDNLIAQLGTNFSGFYELPAGYASLSLTTSVVNLKDTTCGQVLMWLCQASGLWAIADPQNGKLRLMEIPTAGGNEITLANQVSYPTIKANEDIARVEFTLANGTYYSVAGNVDAARVITIRNPFIATTAQADACAASIMLMYGGNSIETVGRGDPTDELGDIVTVETEQGDIDGRLIYADYKYKEGVLTSCVSKMIEVASE